MVRRVALASTAGAALSLGIFIGPAHAQQPAGQTSATLPAVTIDAAKPRTHKRKRSASSSSNTRRAARRSGRPQTQQPPAPVANTATFDARTGTVGYYSNSTSVATKTNTPLLNIAQSVNVVPKQMLEDQATRSITDITRYIPGVSVHQGEGNRDELVIRGVDSSANFFVNGFRDDVQYFRDLYNTQSLEVIKGPSALTFGRGAGGGLVNRTLKEADGQRIYEATAQTGSWGDRRFTIDAGQAVNDKVAVRLNAFYEGSDTFRDFGRLERYGINPTLTWKPTDDTKIKLSYEYYHDKELADRGNPSLAATGTSRFNPTVPFVPNNDFSKSFGSPIYNNTYADVQTTMAVIDHDFGNGLTVKNSTMYADFNRGYTNVYPGSAATVTGPGTGTMNLSAYQNTTNRENLFNQTDFTYKTFTGPIFHTVAFGTEFGRQTGLSYRETGFFPGNTTSLAGVNPFDPTYFGAVTFNHVVVNNPGPGQSSGDSNSVYRLNVSSAYVQDQIDVTHWLQLIAGVRFDRFDMTATDRNIPGGLTRNRIDDKASPRVGVIFKPVDNVSIYGAYSISYLPASGDQFSALSDSTLILDPQKFESTEVGAKWNINPKLLWTAALYNLNRTNQPFPVGNGFSVPNGATHTRGFETALNGYVTADWQSILGYAYTDARVARNLSAVFVAGNRVQLVPYNQFSWWNKYQIDPRWAAALGVIYFGNSYASNDDTVKLPGFVRFDAALYLKIDKTWSAQFNVENIFDKGYWASADGNNNLSPGQGRTFRVLAQAKF
ncbi:TonB-dependent receptor Fiu [Afipia felis]|uniref:TonB-dependent receptor Fiu n=1 Tax=Afipia felis TaxID=1035 RepID=A0A090MQ64_AFIFE|nr:TonB-dependent siderophore receptor [Afipia felis]CEG09506.1 TonB-dependent receptor Fiu [Afipia felis]